MTEGMTTAFDTAITAVKTDFIANVTTALPVGLAIMGITLGLRLAIGFFKSITH